MISVDIITVMPNVKVAYRIFRPLAILCWRRADCVHRPLAILCWRRADCVHTMFCRSRYLHPH